MAVFVGKTSFFKRILKGPGVVIPLIFPKVSQTESLGFPRNHFLVGRSWRHQKAQVAQRSAFREYKIWANMGKEQKLFNK